MKFLIIIFRTFFLYFLLLVMIRIMGKRELGQLSPFDFVVAIMIAELAAIPMEDESIPIINGILPIVILVILQILLSYLTLKNETIRRWINGSPSILIKNGKIQTKEMKKARCNINDILESLRKKNIFDISDVEFAILETSGQLSVMPKSQKRPVTPEDLGIPTSYEGLPTPLIMDGKINHKNLLEINLTEEWLRDQLRKQGVQSVEDVVFASLNTKGELFFATKEQK
ncbi:hypothetical protein BBF96_07040 [Anoxybacter fermentans]|uniref:YetF C-terminal domain-containing protein n=1 Tax=Anoxybacter fermentans TaxID=1323375 RepID=A0A3S9SY28_9FIRM|nr:DUF421 domain-containing protein [Anoxybacter fermentans]AZR73160.1 hypothetical protein BBF96_07040 [Anoxybacter fermentans]